MPDIPPAEATQGSGDQARFERLVKAVTDYAIYMLDTDGKVTSWNAGAERAKGYTEAEILGQHFSRFFTEEDRAAGLPQRALRVARETGRFESEGWRLRKDGTRFWALAVLDAIYDSNGEVIGFAKVTRDMTERRAAEAALVESERRFRQLVTAIVDYALFMLDRDGYIINWNPGAERTKGYKAEEIVGKHFSTFYTEQDRAAGIPQRALATAAREGRFEAVGWRVRKDGSHFWANVVIDPIRDEQGELVGFAKITRDISDKRALELAKEQLYQAQKMETVGQLTGGVAHDFNNLLTAVSGSLSLIGQISTDARIERLVETAQRAVARGAKLTSQLLAFARRQTLKPQTADVNELIGVFEALLRQAVGDMVEFEVDLDPGIWLVAVDEAQFQSALLNLAVNARDAMNGRGGRLVIETRNVELDEARAAALGEVGPGAYVVVSVRDTGPGMSDEVKARAIEPFYTTKDVGKGSGLGLSQVYGFARQSRGQLEIDSAVGRGTAVRIFLPRSEAGSATGARSVGRGAARKAGTVLVVEDDPDVLEVAVESLRTLGYNVLSAANAVEALTILERDVPIDLLFSDVIMPRGMSGVELAQEARRRRPGLRVLLASGYTREVLKGEDTTGGELGFIAKPYQVGQLAEMLRAMLRADACR
jgi:PAS domain S-box-containing protein